MSGSRLVLDTNIVLYLLSGDSTLTDYLEEKQGYLSIVTELELVGYPDIQELELAKIRGFLEGCTIVDLNDEIKSIYVELRRRYRLKLGDAAAAATAIYLGLPFFSADKDFNKILELQFMLYEP